MKKLLIIGAVFLMVNGFTCAPEKVRKASVDFDQSFIPVMYFIMYEDYAQAEKASKMLERKWKVVKNNVKADEWMPEEFEVSPNFVDDRLSALTKAIQQKNKEKATWIAEDIYCALLEWRISQEADYYLDDWLELKRDVDIFANIVNDPLLDLEDWADVEWMHEHITFQWFYISGQPLETAGYVNLDHNAYASRMSQVDQTMMRLHEAMECADRETVAPIGTRLKFDIMETLALFGDFSMFDPLS